MAGAVTPAPGDRTQAHPLTLRDQGNGRMTISDEGAPLPPRVAGPVLADCHRRSLYMRLHDG